MGEVDVDEAFFHDVPAGVMAAALAVAPPQSWPPFAEPWARASGSSRTTFQRRRPVNRWPDMTLAVQFHPVGAEREGTWS